MDDPPNSTMEARSGSCATFVRFLNSANARAGDSKQNTAASSLWERISHWLRDPGLPLRKAIPPAAYDPFIVNSVISILVVAFGTIPPAHQFWQFTAQPLGQALEWVTYWSDPVLINLIGAFSCRYLVYHGLPTPSKFSASVVPLLVCVMALALDCWVMNHSFASTHETDTSRESWLTAEIETLIYEKTGLLPPDPSSPSTSCFVQTFLFLCGLLYARNLRHRSCGRVRWKALPRGEKNALLLLGVGTLIVPLMRISRGFDTVADVALCMSVAAYCFWASFYVIARLLKRFHPASTSGLVAITFLNVPLFMYAAKDTFWWIVVFVAVTGLLGLLHILAGESIRRPQSEIFRGPLREPHQPEYMI